MNRMQLQVEEFFRTIGQEIGTEPKLNDPILRVALIREEADEVIASIDKQDFLGAIDGLCDLLYVTFGAAVAWGIDIEPFFDEVHKRNLTKVGGPKDPVTGKQLKPTGWVPPDHEPILRYMQSAAGMTAGDHTQNKIYWALNRVNRMTDELDLDAVAKVAREAFNEHAQETLGDKCPPAMCKSWDETGEWGREGNRRVAKAVIQYLMSQIINFECGRVQGVGDEDQAQN